MGPEAPSWRITGASVAGTAHAKVKRKCEDTHRCLALPGGTVIVAAADGAGSASRGGDGARLAIDAAIHSLNDALSRSAETANEDGVRNTLADALASARSELEREADRHALLLREYSTTLILLFAGPALVTAAQIGDGGSVIRGSDGAVTALTQPGSEGYVNETTFLTSDDALSSVQFGAYNGSAAGFAVFTDGLQMLALQMPEGTPHQPFFTPLFEFAARVADESQAQKELIDFLRSPRITQRTDDDLTLVLGSRIS